MTSRSPAPPEDACDAQAPIGRRRRRLRRRARRSAALEAEGAEKATSREEEQQPLAMSSSTDHGDPLAAAEPDPTKAHLEEEPIQEDARCNPGQLPPDEAGHPKSYCQAWHLAPLEDARFLICCTNWY